MADPINQKAAVVWPVVHTFDDPADPGSVQTQLRHGAVVHMLEHRDVVGRAWTRVRYGWGVQAHVEETDCQDIGWIEAAARIAADKNESAGRYARRPTSSVSEATQAGQWLSVVSLAAHVFAKPSRTAGPSLRVLPRESFLWGRELTEVQAAPGAYGSRWWRADLPDGQEVFVQAGDVEHVAARGPLATAEALAEVMRMVGRPYVWGGASSFGLDCSGLVQMFARLRGVALPHSARRQFTETAAFAGLGPAGQDLTVEQVSGGVRSEGGRGDACSSLGLEFAERARGRWSEVLRPGDVVYFAMGGQRVDHVGLWAGDGEMLHASSSALPAVRREPFWGSVYAARMVGVRRVGSAAGAELV